jgi:chitin disaccharide deacetylase
MKLIINSDDFGLTPGVNLGIIDAHRRGVLTSTTTMMNMPGTEMAPQLAKENPDLGIGLHLVLTAGRPLVEGHKTIVDEQGNFLKNAVLIKKTDLDIEEVYQEYVAQMEKFIRLFGRKPTHIDGHHHTHAYPHTKEATLRLAKAYDIDYVRSLKEIPFIVDFYGDRITVDHFKSILDVNLDKAIAELMVHVGFIDVELMQLSSYNYARVKELETLISAEAKAYIQDKGITLTHF